MVECSRSVRFVALKLVVFLVLFCSLYGVAQQPIAHSIGKQDGLPTQVIYNILQDKEQYIWLGTEKGLVRYDETRFVTYFNAHSRSSSVSDLQVDEAGNLYCQNFSGQHFVWRQDSLLLDREILVTGNFSPLLLHKGSRYKRVFDKVYKQQKQLDTLAFGRELYELFVYNETVFAFDSAAVFSIEGDSPPVSIPFSLRGETVFFTAVVNGKVLVFPRSKTPGVCYQFFPEFRQVRVEMPAATILCVEVIDRQIFVGTNDGLYVYDENLVPIAVALPLLPGKRISSVIKDREGAVWVATLDDGLFKFHCWNCINYPTESSLTAIAFGKRAGEFLVASSTGKVYEWSREEGLSKLFSLENRQPIVALGCDVGRRDVLVAGDLFTVFDPTGGKEVHPYAVKQIARLGHNGFMLSRTGGLTMMRPSAASGGAKKGGKWLFEDRDSHRFMNWRVRASVYDSAASAIYVATSVGLFSLAKNQLLPIRDNGADIIAVDLQMIGDTLVVATPNKGLLFVKNNRVIKRWNVAHSMLPNSIKVVRCVGAAIWVLGNNKLYHILPQIDSVQCVDIGGHDCEIADFLVDDSSLYLATEKGLLVVSLHKQLPVPLPLKIYLHRFATDKRGLLVQQKNVLQHKENNISVEFSLPYYGAADELNVYYRINEEVWRTVEQGQRKLSFLSLEPGEYDVQLKAASADGRVSEIKHIFFRITPPFWQTWWFYTLSMLLVAGSGYILYRYRLYLVQKQNDLERQKVELENKLHESILASVKAQMNPHFIFNALNTIQSFIYLNDKKNATTYLGKFSQLTRTILDMSNKNTVSLQEEIDALLLYLELEKTRFDEELAFEMVIAPGVNPDVVHIPSMIIQPYVENAVKHGLLHQKGARWLNCLFELDNGFLRVTIDDNGIGRKRSLALNSIKNKQHQSFATHANEKRLDALNRGNSNTVSVRYIDKVSPLGEPQGTTVVLMIALEE